MALQPMLKGFQLIGDSQALRFAGSQLGFDYRMVQKRFNLCISGIRIENMIGILRNSYIRTNKYVILIIGCNHFHKKKTKDNEYIDVDVDEIEQLYDSLIAELKARGCLKILAVTLPPFLCYFQDGRHKKSIKDFNRRLKSKADDIVNIIDICPHFLYNHKKSIRRNMYTHYYYPSGRKDDLHWSHEAFKIIYDLFCIHIDGLADSAE